MADTTFVESREQENRPQSYEEFKRMKVADTTVVESRESEDRHKAYEEEFRTVAREDHQYHGNSTWRRSETDMKTPTTRMKQKHNNRKEAK